jgi:hypothetical protein
MNWRRLINRLAASEEADDITTQRSPHAHTQADAALQPASDSDGRYGSKPSKALSPQSNRSGHGHAPKRRRVPKCMGPAARRKTDFQDDEREVLHQCIRPHVWSSCSGPAWVSTLSATPAAPPRMYDCQERYQGKQVRGTF